MRALLIAAALLAPAAALSQAPGGAPAPAPPPPGVSSGVPSPGTPATPPTLAPGVSPTQTAPVGPSPVAPNISPSQAAPPARPGLGQSIPNPSDTQAAPPASPVPQPGQNLAQPPSGSGTATGRVPESAQELEKIEADRKAREERMRQSEDRLRALIRDICSGCDYRDTPAEGRRNVVRAKG